MLYNKFNANLSTPPNNPPKHPNSDYNCVVATTGQRSVSACRPTDLHRVVCQLNTLTGISTNCFYILSFFYRAGTD